jgi:hypothetical protein
MGKPLPCVSHFLPFEIMNIEKKAQINECVSNYLSAGSKY